MMPLSYNTYGATTILIMLAILIIGKAIKHIRSKSIKH